MSQLRIGGLASGMDIDSIIEKLMTAERAPLDKLEQQKQKYEWTRDAYRNVNTKLQTFDTYISDNLLLKSFNTKTASVSNSAYVEATATGSASGTLIIEGVSQLATAARKVGNQVNATANTKLSDLGISGNGSFELKAIKADGTMPSETTKIEYSDSMTVSQLISKINSSGAGVTALFENGRLSISAKNTGDNKDGAEVQLFNDSQNIFGKLGIQSDGVNLADGGTNAVFQVNGIATERASNKFSINGYSVTLKSVFNSSTTLNKFVEAAQTEYNNAKLNLEDRTDAEGNPVKGLRTLKQEAEDAYNALGTTIENKLATTFGSFASLVSFISDGDKETYNSLGAAFFNNLTEADIDKIINIDFTADEPLAGLDPEADKDLINKLKSLSPTQKEKLDSLTKDQLTNFKELSNYNTLGKTFLNNLTTDEINKIASIDFTAEDPYAGLDQEQDKDLIKKLKALSASQKTALDNLSADKLQAFTQFANYSTLGKDVLNKLSDDEIDKITSIDFTAEDPYASLDQVADKDLINKLKGLSAAQRTALGNLSKDQILAFKDVANVQDVYDKKEQAKTNLENGEKRLQTAESSLQNAFKQAKDAGLLQTDANGQVITDADNPYGIIDSSKVQGATTESVQITSTTNVDEIVNKIKDFVTTYNGLITELNNLVKEEKYKDYPPLTSAQREELDEKEIELWEQKAKSGLLRSDSIIREGLSSMRTLVYQTNSAVSNPKYNTLFSIGITTSKSYNDGGTLEIDETKLRKAIEEDPDAVTALFTNTGNQKDTTVENGVTKTVDTRGYLKKLRDTMSSIKEKIEKKAGRSTMTANQYTLGKTLTDIEKRISTWKDKLDTIENRYWKQFTAMEQAIQKANTQASYFMQQ